MIAAIGLDPGATSGAALVAVPWGADPRPRLLAATAITASSPTKLRGPARTAEWTRRYQRAAEEALRRFRCILPAHRLDEVALAVEERPGSTGPTEEVYGLGCRTGQLVAAVEHIFGRAPELVPQPWWTEILDVPPRKSGGGGHRIEEASARLVGAAELLDQVPATARVDVAEACLLALAVLLEGA